MAAVLARTPGAFEQLVRLNEKLVWHLVHRMVQQPEVTRELCQEVYLKVFQQLHRFRFESTLSTWVGRIAFSVASRHLRRRQLPMADPGDERGGNDADAVAQLADDYDLQQTFEDAEQVERLAAAIERLPPLQRTLVTMYHLDELAISEISTITDLAEGTVKSHLFRARRKLRQLLP